MTTALAPERGWTAEDGSRISLQGIGKQYTSVNGESVQGLSPLSLEIAPESFVAIVGRSGCGKSTLLRLVAGLEEPTAGSVRIGDQVVAGSPPAVRYVFQNYSDSLLPWRSVGDNVRFGLRHAYRPHERTGRAGERDLVESYLAEVGLPGTAGRYVSELSGGQQQRVAIARALAARPSVLLLDEPFSAVDALSRATLQDLVSRILREHRLTILFVTHDIDEALYLSDRVIVLRPGGGGLEEDVAVEVPRPRDQVTSREYPEYLRLRREVLQRVLS